MKPSVLVTKRIFPEAVELLSRHAGVEYVESDDGIAAADLPARCRGKQGVIAQLTDRFDAAVIAQLEGVRVIANVAVGHDNIDLPAAARAGIVVTNTPDVLTGTTADLAFALLLAAARRIVEADRFVHSGQWKRWTIDLLAGFDVHHKTLGILGMGRIGQAVARRAAGFDMRVLSCGSAATREDKERLLAESDFVSLHVPLTAATRHLIGAAELACMKPSAILVNTSRGPVVDENALVDALRARRIAAAGLDVFEQEPRVHAGLLELDNVVLAPHIGSASVETRRRMSFMAAENAIAVLEGRQPANMVK